jgi:hypothetical protein
MGKTTHQPLEEPNRNETPADKIKNASMWAAATLV